MYKRKARPCGNPSALPRFPGPCQALRSFLSKNYRLCRWHIRRRTANDRVATGAEKKVSASRHSAKQKRPGAEASPQTFSALRGTPSQYLEKEKRKMSKKNNRINVPEAREAMDKFKMEAASEVGVNLKEGYNGDISAREAGSVGGQMVKKMIESYEKNL